MANRKLINSPRLSTSSSPLSPAVKVGDLVFVSGITPFKPGTREMAPDFAGQMRQVMENIKAILGEAGTTLDKAVKMNVILTRISDFDEMNSLYRTYFKDSNFPARTTIGAALAAPGMLVEIECVAEA